MAPKRLVFTSRSPTPWRHDMAHTLFTSHLYSFDGPIAMEEELPSLEPPTRPTNDRPAIFGH